jgi:hypothetical protein
MNIKLSGIVGKPETRYTPEGKAVLTFSLCNPQERILLHDR